MRSWRRVLREHLLPPGTCCLCRRGHSWTRHGGPLLSEPLPGGPGSSGRTPTAVNSVPGCQEAARLSPLGAMDTPLPPQGQHAVPGWDPQVTGPPWALSTPLLSGPPHRPPPHPTASEGGPEGLRPSVGGGTLRSRKCRQEPGRKADPGHWGTRRTGVREEAGPAQPLSDAPGDPGFLGTRVERHCPGS